MSDEICDIHDVTRAASDLVGFGCSIGALHFFDGFAQMQFSAIISSYVNEIIQAVDEGIISALQGIQEIREEYAELSSKVLFYSQNSVGVLAGAMQFEAGITTLATSRGLALVPGVPYVAHGFNNMYEGIGNIYNGPGTSGVVGPIRKIYQDQSGNSHNGNMLYYSTDLLLSGYGMVKLVRRPGSVQLFERDPINYERAYKQMGGLALAFEALIDAITIKTMNEEIKSNNFKDQHPEK